MNVIIITGASEGIGAEMATQLAQSKGAAVALVLAGVVLNGLFERHVQQQFEQTLTHQLDQVMARFELDARGQPAMSEQALSDPRWNKPCTPATTCTA